MKSNSFSDTLTKNFIELVKIPSPSGKEKKMAEYLKKRLASLNWNVMIDNSGSKNNADIGNVIAHMKQKQPGKTYLFIAHMDTVQNEKDTIKPVFKRGSFFSDGKTILGADNKAGVADLLTIAELITNRLLHTNANIYLAFTTREESGQMGSKYLDIKSIKPEFIFNVDGTGPIGTIDYASLSYTAFELHIKGKAAHSAIEPEKGISALQVASSICNRLTFGKRSNGSTFNIGVIRGGEKANVVMPDVYIKGEIRAFSDKVLEKELSTFEDVVKKQCHKFGAKFTLNILENIPPFIGSKESPIVSLVEKAIKKSRISPLKRKAFYTSDASYLAQAGYPTVTLCKGGKYSHTSKETITLVELKLLFSILQNIIESA